MHSLLLLIQRTLRFFSDHWVVENHRASMTCRTQYGLTYQLGFNTASRRKDTGSYRFLSNLYRECERFCRKTGDTVVRVDVQHRSIIGSVTTVTRNPKDTRPAFYMINNTDPVIRDILYLGHETVTIIPLNLPRRTA